MSSDPLLETVTVAIPAYNLQRHLTDAVLSVQRQDYAGAIRIIILDDGSNDGTLSLARKLADRDTRIEVTTQSNQGRAKTRNRLLELATTEMVCWIDADDMASPTWIRDQVSHLIGNESCVAVGGQGYAMTASGDPIGPMIHPLESGQIDDLHVSGKANAFFQSCVSVRRSAVLKAGAYDERYPAAEDFSLWLRLAEQGELCNLSATHLYYRVHGSSANWTLNVEQRLQGHAIMNEARIRRGFSEKTQPTEQIAEPKKDDWNRRVYWINIALRSGNPRSSFGMSLEALRRHPASMVLWAALMVSCLDTIVFLGNRTPRFRPGKVADLGTLPRLSWYRLGRHLNRIRRSGFA